MFLNVGNSTLEFYYNQIGGNNSRFDYTDFYGGI